MQKQHYYPSQTLLISKTAVLGFCAWENTSNSRIIGPSRDNFKVFRDQLCLSNNQKTMFHSLEKSNRLENPSSSPSSSLLLRDFG